MDFSLINYLVQLEEIEYCFIGSRRFTDNLSPGTDYDVMFHAEQRDMVYQGLIDRGIEFEEKAHGSLSIKIRYIDVPNLDTIEYNFCFVKDFEAWKMATETMVTISAILGGRFFHPNNMKKRKRIALFSALVFLFGGEKPPIYKDLSS